MDLSKVTAITIPQGAAKSVACDGQILWQPKGIPSAYQQVEYLLSDGFQAVDTGINGVDYPGGIGYEMDIELTQYTSLGVGNYAHFFGCADTENKSHSGYFSFSINSGNGNVICGQGAKVLVYYYELKNCRVTLKLFADPSNAVTAAESFCILRNGENVTPKTVVYAGHNGSMPNGNIYVLNCNGVNQKGIIGRLYGFKMWDAAQNLIRDLVPCYRKSDGEAGMYDLAEGGFYPNVGSGHFSVGPIL